MVGANGRRGGEDGGTWSSPFRKPLSSRSESGPTGRLGAFAGDIFNEDDWFRDMNKRVISAAINR